MKGDIKMAYLGFMNHGLDREFELDSDLDETFEQLIFTIHKLKFTLVIIPRCQSGETSSSPPVATVTATTTMALRPLNPDTQRTLDEISRHSRVLALVRICVIVNYYFEYCLFNWALL